MKSFVPALFLAFLSLTVGVALTFSFPTSEDNVSKCIATYERYKAAVDEEVAALELQIKAQDNLIRTYERILKP